MEVLFEGGLDKCSSADSEQGKKEWKRRHFVVKHLIASDVHCLEYYKDKNWRGGRQDPKGVLNLYPGYRVVKVHEPKRRFVFDVKTVEHTFRLAASSLDSMNEWFQVLENVNIVKSFNVEIEPGEQFTKLGAVGPCLLHIAESELRLVAAVDGHLLVAWPFKCLRRYMSSKGKFTIEAGRRAPTGEGMFTFYSPLHDDMYRLLDSVVKSKASKGQPVSHGHDDQKQPIPASSPATAVAPQVTGISSDGGYDHLKSIESPLPSHPPHPNYNHGMSLATSTEVAKDSGYASPYGHLKSMSISSSTPIQALACSVSSSDVISGRDSHYDNNYDTLIAPHQDKEPDVLQFSKQPEEDTYNVLCNAPTPCKPSVVATVDTEDFYDVLSHDTMKEGTSPPAVEPDDVYNTLSHPQSSPTKTSVYDSLSPVHSPVKCAADEMYNTLGHQPSVVKGQEIPVQGGDRYVAIEHSQSPQPPDRLRAGHISSPSIDDDMYNTLSHSTLSASQVQPRPWKPNELMSTYNTLEHDKSHFPVRKVVSFDADDSYNVLGHVSSRSSRASTSSVPERCPLENGSQSRLSGESPDILRAGSVTSASFQCPLDIPITDSSRSSVSSSASPGEFDSYASLDYASISPPAGKAPPVPVHRTSSKPAAEQVSRKDKPRPPPPRKGSAPDVLANVPRPEMRSPSKSVKGGARVSNLRASLEAGGFDLTKPKPKPRKPPSQVSQEDSIPETDADLYAEVEDKDVITVMKAGRSPSVPTDPADDIYDEPDKPPPAPRPKSVPYGKTKKKLF